MNPRPILQKSGSLKILVDSENLAEKWEQIPKIEKLLSYQFSEYFDFTRTPFFTGIEDIDRIKHFVSKFDGNIGSIKFRVEKRRIARMVTSQLSNVELIAKEIFKNQTINSEEWNKIWHVFVNSALSEDYRANIFVTEDEEILKKREWFREHFPRFCNICTTSEAMEIMGLYSKNLGKYLLSNFSSASKSIWYWMSFRSKIPHYNVPVSNSSSLEAFSYRFVFLLMSMDEMGKNHFDEINPTTGDNTHYHFNYFITLMTGIFDSLALETRNRYDIKFNGDHIPSRISMNKDSGKDFLKKVRTNNPSLRNHVTKFAEFINLVYDLREAVVHGNFQRPVTFASLSRGNENNLIRVSNNISRWINLLHDKPKSYDSHTEWGLYSTQIGSFISPYEFSKMATRQLIEFSDIYLEKLGLPNFLQNNATSQFGKELLEIRENGLSS